MEIRSFACLYNVQCIHKYHLLSENFHLKFGKSKAKMILPSTDWVFHGNILPLSRLSCMTHTKQRKRKATNIINQCSNKLTCIHSYGQGLRKMLFCSRRHGVFFFLVLFFDCSI